MTDTPPLSTAQDSTPTAHVDEHFDLIIIGTGSGNSIPGPEFDDKKIAIVEKGTFGGTCLNVGCIPTKMFVYAAEVAQTIKDSGKYGISSEITGVDWPSIQERVFTKRVDAIAQGGEDYRRGDETPNISVFDQHAVFIAPKTIRTGQGATEKVITGDQIVIAAGARPFIPPVIAESGVKYYTNEDIMRIPELPKSMIVMGGGFIAVEFANIFQALGVDVTLINRSEKLLRQNDVEISTRFTEEFAKHVNCKLGVNITGASQQATSGNSGETHQNETGPVSLALDNGESITADLLLVATGRTPNGDQMDLGSAGIEMTSDKRIQTDEFGRTTAEGVWALGDVSSPYQLKHVANAEMRAIKHNLLNPDNLKKLPHDLVPAAVFTHPQIATVGLTEDQARAAGHNVTVKVQNYGDVAFGWAMEDSTGICKLIADKTSGKLLGAHLMGPQASTLIQQLITVMAFNLDVRSVATDQYWIHPALPELIENALLGLEFD